MVRAPDKKILSWEETLERRGQLREAGKVIAVTNGCFDLFHRGHAEYLYHARQKADALLILLNSDSSVREVKGPHRPLIDEYSRAYLLASLEAVDIVTIFSSSTCLSQLRELQPEVYVKGGDYKEETLVQEEYHLLRSMGAKIELIPAVKGLSTTTLLERISSLDNSG